MFNNLIESTSHAKEFKRRGSFLLFTSATYVVLFVITGVVSIYAYDARLEEQTLEIVMLLPPQEIVPDAQPRPAERPDRPRDVSNTRTLPERAVAMLDVSHPEIVPDTISATPNRHLPLPPGGAVITGSDFNPESVGGPGSQSSGGAQVVQPRPTVVIPDLPPPPPKPEVPKVLKVSRVLNSQALSLPRPEYPPIAKQIGTQGNVIVQVLIDETGKVISAKATSGSPLLIPAAQKAALQARFSPTLIGETPVKVSGVITYNFVLSR